MDDLRAQVARLQADIARQEAELADLEAAVLDIQRELDDFSARYDRQIKPLLDRLDIIRAVIADLEAAHGLPHGLEAPPARDIRSAFPPDYVPVEEQFRRAWQVPRQDAELPPRPDPSITARPEESADALRQVYRQLARRFHPDLSADPLERERRNRLMTEINDAYTRRDLGALRALARQPESASTEEPLAAIQLRQLLQVHDQLLDRTLRLQQMRHDLMNSDLMWLKIQETLAARKGRHLLREMAAQLERDYAACLDRLDQLRGS